MDAIESPFWPPRQERGSRGEAMKVTFHQRQCLECGSDFFAASGQAL